MSTCCKHITGIVCENPGGHIPSLVPSADAHESTGNSIVETKQCTVHNLQLYLKHFELFSGTFYGSTKQEECVESWEQVLLIS